MAVRLLAIDIDGTLVDSQSQVTAANRAAIRRAQELGVAVVLVTGRRFRTSAPIARELGIDLPIIAHNGALVRHGITGHVVYHQSLPRRAACIALSVARGLGADPIAHYALSGDGRATVERSASLRNSWLSKWVSRNADAVDQVEDLEAAITSEPTVLTIFAHPQKSTRLRTRLEHELGHLACVFEASYPHLELAFLDVVHPECSKAATLRFVAGSMGIATSEIMAVGDNYNDLPLLACVGIPVLMGNAPDDLKRLGFHVTLSNDEDGLAAAIETFVLGTRPV